MSLRRWLAACGGLVVFLILAGFFTQLPSIAAGGLLHPRRMAAYSDTPSACVEREFAGEGLTLRGWSCAARTPFRGSLVYLHGVADNRSSSVRLIERLTARGFDVIAYDSRAHGQSDGDTCTYGFFEKLDLRQVMNTLRPGPIVLIGSSLGAAVALQAAVGQPRVVGVVAAEAFSDLRTIATERAPAYLPAWTIRRAFGVAEQQARFDVASVSPVAAARALHIPVLLIHGADDQDTSPAHSQRLLAALGGPKRLILVANAGHNQAMSGSGVWSEIEQWLDGLVLQTLSDNRRGTTDPGLQP
jgi:pimeloyl-ACP methyl ester carboxylesterase